MSAANGDFSAFRRGDNGYEAIEVYWAIETAQRYYQDVLGLNNAANYQIPVNARWAPNGNPNVDNSRYLSNGSGVLVAGTFTRPCPPNPTPGSCTGGVQRVSGLAGEFRVDVERSRYQLAAGAPDRVPRRTRLAYRDVASATNRLTLIAAMIPARAVTTHTLFCLKTPHSLAAQHVLCGLLNSFVANYLVRFRVHTHVTASLVSRLPVPFIEPDDAVFERIAALVRVLLDAAAAVEDMEEYAELQARVARLYQMSGGEFEHVLSTFPLIPERIKSKALAMFNRYFSDTHLAASPFRSTAVPRR